MNWNLTPEEERAIHRYGYAELGLFWRIFVPRLLKMAPPKTRPVVPPTEADVQSTTDYVPLAHRK